MTIMSMIEAILTQKMRFRCEMAKLTGDFSQRNEKKKDENGSTRLKKKCVRNEQQGQQTIRIVRIAMRE